MAQLASKGSSEGSKWTHLEPRLPTLEAPLATWDIHSRIFAHFYKVFVNNCAFLQKTHGKATKIQQNAPIIMNIAQQHGKSA